MRNSTILSSHIKKECYFVVLYSLHVPQRHQFLFSNRVEAIFSLVLIKIGKLQGESMVIIILFMSFIKFHLFTNRERWPFDIEI